MTYVSTPSPGTFPRAKRARRLSTTLVAVAITVAAGAAIGIGVAVSQNDVAPAQSIYESPEALKYVTPADSGAATADRIHRDRAMHSAAEATGSAASTMTHDEIIEALTNTGRLPAGAIPTGTAGAATSTMTNEQFIALLVATGRIPAGAFPTGTVTTPVVPEAPSATTGPQ